MPRALIHWFRCAFLLCGFVAFAHGQAPAAAQPRGLGAIKVAKVVGEVYVVDASSARVRLTPSALVSAGQVIETGANASVVLVFSNGALVNVRANTQLEVNQFLQDPFSGTFSISRAVAEPSTSATRLNLRKGEVVSQVKKLNREAGSSFTIETPVGAAGIRGTAFRLSFVPRATAARFALTMAEGLIQFIPIRGRAVEVGAGKELAFDAQIDATTGQVLSVPDLPALVDVAPSDLAELQAVLLETMGASATIEFTPNPAAGTPVAGATSSTDAPAPEMASAAPGSDPATSVPAASPGPISDTPRLSPGSGE
jgi:hypothetical protein